MGLLTNPDEYFMRQALAEARAAMEEDEIPVGAIVVCDGSIIARAHNLTERLHDVTAHAEMMAFTAAAEYLGAKYLTDCTLYVTLEPCVMCAGAAGWTQVARIVYGASDPKRGFMRLGREMPHSRFILQDDLGALREVTKSSTLPAFVTDLSMHLPGNDSGRINIPVSDKSATMSFWCCCMKKNEKRFQKWFKILERRVQTD